MLSLTLYAQVTPLSPPNKVLVLEQAGEKSTRDIVNAALDPYIEERRRMQLEFASSDAALGDLRIRHDQLQSRYNTICSKHDDAEVLRTFLWSLASLPNVFIPNFVSSGVSQNCPTS